jgi:hypothetical protein
MVVVELKFFSEGQLNQAYENWAYISRACVQGKKHSSIVSACVWS